MSENDVVMALSQKMATLERRLETIAKLHLQLTKKYEELLTKVAQSEDRNAGMAHYDD